MSLPWYFKISVSFQLAPSDSIYLLSNEELRGEVYSALLYFRFKHNKKNCHYNSLYVILTSMFAIIVVDELSCSSVELVGPKPESGFQQDNLIVASNRPRDLEMISRCRSGR